MWIVRLALNRPYTFIVLSLLILLASPVVIQRTPTDIFPNINIPVVAVAWQFTGLNPEEMEGRFTTGFERILTTVVDNIEHIESTTINGQSIIKVFLQPNASLAIANAQITAVSQVALRQLPAGAQPPLILNFSASTVPIIQLALSGEGLSEQQLNDLGLNFLRTQLVTVPGAAVPYPYGGKQTQVMIDLNPALLQSKGLSATDVVNAVNLQNLVLPSGTAKIGQFEYDVDINGAPRTVEQLNDLPIKQVGSSTIYLRDVAHVRNGFAPQTNIVRHDGLRGVLVTVLKAGSASTLDVVNGIRDDSSACRGHAAAPAKSSAACGSIDLRPRRHERRHPRSRYRRLPHRFDDPDFPGKLAQHTDHCGFHPAVHSSLDHRSQCLRRNHQHYDARRARARGGHAGG